MNTDQLYEILWNDTIATAYVMAIMPSNALKYVRPDQQERCYIVNCNENSYLRGEAGHWMILIVHSRDVIKKTRNEESCGLEVFDSLGERTYNGEMTAFMSKFKYCTTYSEHLANRQCGYYSLVYVYYRSRKYEPASVIHLLSKITDVKSHCLALYSMHGSIY